MAKPEIYDHRKFLRLKRILNEPTPHVIGYLECIWRRGYQTGDAFIGDEFDVEAAAEYPGETGRLRKALEECGFIDRGSDGKYTIHDLFDHAPSYAKKRMARIGNLPEGVTEYSGIQPDGNRVKTRRKSKNGIQMESERNPDGIHVESNGTQNREPRTENQEPRTKNTNTSPPPLADGSSSNSQKPRKSRKPKPETNPNHTPAVQHFTERWRVWFRADYPFAGGKDAKAIERILASIGNDLEKFKRIVERYFANSAPFFAGHNLTKLESSLATFIAEPVQQHYDPMPGESK